MSSENEEQSIPIKRRGRKRKAEVLSEGSFESDTPITDTVSARGRRHRRINYYDLANPNNLEEYPLNHSNDENKDYSKSSRKKKITEENGAETVEKPQLEIEEISSNGTSLNGDDEAASSTTKNKDKKYNYTGETVKMMNTLFTHFTKKEGECEGNINGGDGDKQPKKSAKKLIKEEDLDDGFGNVTCAICNNILDKNLWSHHKQRYHNNLAWRVGDTPLDLSDQTFVMHTLNNLYKKKKPLYCDKCGEVKKSVVGFLSHQSICRKSEEQLESVKISCDLCGKRMLPVSMTTHLKYCHQNVKLDIVEKKTGENNKIGSTSNKRSAAKKALKIIEDATKNDINEGQYFSSNINLSQIEFAKNLMEKELEEKQFLVCKFGCGTIVNKLEEALEHHGECDNKPSDGFVCKQCLLICSKIEDLFAHLEIVHEIVMETDSEVTFEEEKTTSRLPSFLNSSVRKTERVLFPEAFAWTYKFQNANFSANLFENISNPEWQILPRQLVTEYLPKMDKSCDVARIHVTSFINPLNSDYEFKQYQLFESEVHDNKISIFCGGPISALSWVPTPHTALNKNQILAVSVLKSPDEKYPTNGAFAVDTAIQFWDFGSLQNKEKSSLKQPKLIFNLVLRVGPIWHMEWCPSGCFNEEINRMGLVAITGSDSIVYIYSVPFLNTSLYYQAKPVMKLILQRLGSPLLGGLQYYPTKISWSKYSGHNFVAVGYTNGFIGLYNLSTNSKISKFHDGDGIICILPYQCFQAHSHSISALALHHLNEGCRWLMSGSVDRAVSLWDLNNCRYPVNTVRKNIVTDGFWFTNWLSYVTAADEGSTATNVITMLKQVRDYMSDSSITLTCSPSTIMTIAGSDWVNGMLHANVLGEIVALFPHQIFYLPDHTKFLKKKRMLFGYTCLIDKTKTPQERVEADQLRKKVMQNLMSKKLSTGVKLGKIRADIDHISLNNEPVVYRQAQERYALLFCDNKMESYSDHTPSVMNQLSALSKSYGISQPNQYPLNAINKITLNPNRQASLFYATGYQAGFVRISWMEFLKGDHQIK